MTLIEAIPSEIVRMVAEEQARYPVPGLSMGVTTPDEEWATAFGVTSVDHPIDVDADTLLQIGSISKTFLGTLVMRLVDESKLDLDTPVRRWVPELRLRDEDAAARVTLRHCLTHTCGWFGDHFIDTGDDTDALAKYVASMETLEQQVPLGSVWAYNNAAFGLAGRVVEKVTDMPVETAMRELLFEPLGLERTFFFANDVITHRFVVGHNAFPEGPQVVRRWALPRASNCVGGIVSSVPELLRYARFHMGDGTTADGARYLSPEAIEHMRSPLVAGPVGEHRGIAWAVSDMKGTRLISHGGATFGQLALLHIAPARRVAFAMLTNSNRATQLQNRFIRWARERYLGIPPARPEPRPHTADEAAAATGTYRNPSNELRVVMEDGGLVLYQRPLDSGFRALQRNPPPVPEPATLAFTRTPRRLVLTSGPLEDTQIELLTPEWVRFSSRLYRKEDA